jgi:hypothetical protein
MNRTKIKRIVQLMFVMAIVGLSLQPISAANAVDNPNGPELPAQCSSIQAPEGSQLAFHVYARGVQIYRWNGTSWDFVAPRASLFAEPGFFGEVGSHYAGPTWESKSGSTVKGRRVLGTGCTPDPNAIAWLLLERVESSGPGLFASVAYIQRVNTTGGLAPVAPGLTVGDVQEVGYTAEYFFYRAQ